MQLIEVCFQCLCIYSVGFVDFLRWPFVFLKVKRLKVKRKGEFDGNFILSVSAKAVQTLMPRAYFQSKVEVQSAILDSVWRVHLAMPEMSQLTFPQKLVGTQPQIYTISGSEAAMLDFG